MYYQSTRNPKGRAICRHLVHSVQISSVFPLYQSKQRETHCFLFHCGILFFLFDLTTLFEPGVALISVILQPDTDEHHQKDMQTLASVTTNMMCKHHSQKWSLWQAREWALQQWPVSLFKGTCSGPKWWHSADVVCLHGRNQGSNLGIPYSPPSMPGVIPGYRARCNPWQSPGMTQKKRKKKACTLVSNVCKVHTSWASQQGTCTTPSSQHQLQQREGGEFKTIFFKIV